MTRHYTSIRIEYETGIDSWFILGAIINNSDEIDDYSKYSSTPYSEEVEFCILKNQLDILGG